MSVTIALAGNPNCGKTTLFNALTGSNQFVGNWPGVTVEKKEGKLKGHKDVIVTDLPGIYSLSPYTLEEVVARNYLINEKPDVIFNIVDGTNIERNLYLTTQLIELGIPVIMAVNMMDLVNKNGDKIYLDKLAKHLGCEVVEISALKGTGVKEAAERALALAKGGKRNTLVHKFDTEVEKQIDSVKAKLSGVPEEQKRFFAIKLLERDEKIAEQMKQSVDASREIEILEEEFDDDTESIITNERYTYISSMIHECVTKNAKRELTISDKIDKIVTNRFLALPIFAFVMFIVYYVSVTSVGTIATDWANDGVFGDGWFAAGVGREAFDEADGEFNAAVAMINAFAENAGNEDIAEAIDNEAEDFDFATASSALSQFVASVPADTTVTYTVFADEDTLETEDITANVADLQGSVEVYNKYEGEGPDPANYGPWIPGIPVFIEAALDKLQPADWLRGVIMQGIVAGVGAVLGFVPQILILFIFLAFLEACGYMARVAFIMDRIFRKFGLSGRSFIPYLIGSGCGVPGIMATRTIENEKDRRMTIMTTTFIPCGAKLPFIAMIAGSIFGGAAWVSPFTYFLGIFAVIISGIILKKTKMFAGDPAPFVMELPAYHMPTVGNVLRSMWERGWAFIKKAGTIILLSTIVIWFVSFFGFVDGSFTMLSEDQLDSSIIATIGQGIAWIFAPLGWGTWQAAVASVIGLVAKENIVATLGIVYGGEATYANMAAAFSVAAGLSFLVFNLLCAPCFAALGAIRREMNSAKWFWTAVGYQCGFAYLVAMVFYNVAGLVTGTVSVGIGTVVSAIIVIAGIYLLVRPESKAVKASKAGLAN
ncbi:Ferrous iron transport protein B [Lachnospiraceae bacterium TWA4]|nr:Ferrous iron transport protein B [Lachnospiraceae bacterium TWA4]